MRTYSTGLAMFPIANFINMARTRSTVGVTTRPQAQETGALDIGNLGGFRAWSAGNND